MNLLISLLAAVFLAINMGGSGTAPVFSAAYFDPGFTLSVYSGVTNKMKQEATDKIGDLLANCLNNK